MNRIIAAQIEDDEVIAIKTIGNPCLAYNHAMFHVATGISYEVQMGNEKYYFEVKKGKLVEIPIEIMKKLPSF